MHWCECQFSFIIFFASTLLLLRLFFFMKNKFYIIFSAIICPLQSPSVPTSMLLALATHIYRIQSTEFSQTNTKIVQKLILIVSRILFCAARGLASRQRSILGDHRRLFWTGIIYNQRVYLSKKHYYNCFHTEKFNLFSSAINFSSFLVMQCTRVVAIYYWFFDSIFSKLFYLSFSQFRKTRREKKSLW